MEAFEYWNNRPLKEIHWAVTCLASDVNHYLESERKAILQVAALNLGKLVELRQILFLDTL
jgi:hypothetical protein